MGLILFKVLFNLSFPDVIYTKLVQLFLCCYNRFLLIEMRREVRICVLFLQMTLLPSTRFIDFCSDYLVAPKLLDGLEDSFLISGHPLPFHLLYILTSVECSIPFQKIRLTLCYFLRQLNRFEVVTTRDELWDRQKPIRRPFNRFLNMPDNIGVRRPQPLSGRMRPLRFFSLIGEYFILSILISLKVVFLL